MMFAILFGLSMDYQVFLLSQVEQHRAEGREPDQDAVAQGLALSARVIAAAALIMIAVFGSFILNGDPTVKQFGVGLAVAVALAAHNGDAPRTGAARALRAVGVVASGAGSPGSSRASTSRAGTWTPKAEPRSLPAEE